MAKHSATIIRFRPAERRIVDAARARVSLELGEFVRAGSMALARAVFRELGEPDPCEGAPVLIPSVALNIGQPQPDADAIAALAAEFVPKLSAAPGVTSPLDGAGLGETRTALRTIYACMIAGASCMDQLRADLAEAERSGDERRAGALRQMLATLDGAHAETRAGYWHLVTADGEVSPPLGSAAAPVRQ